MIEKKNVTEILRNRSLVKQEVFSKTLDCYKEFRKVIEKEINTLRKDIPEEKVRLKYSENSEFETHAYVGSDVLVFNMHSNIFTFNDRDRLWFDSYVQENKWRGFFGIIHVYNFLAESFLQNRLNDAGYLLGRIFVNFEGHFMVEGKQELGIRYRNLRTNVFDKATMQDVFLTSVKLASEFDLNVPPYEHVSIVDVQQIKEVTSSQKLKTGKRLGFKY